MEKQSTRKFLKLFVALVALFLLGSSALLLSSCKEEHTHDWGEGTVTVQPTCTAQGFKTFECSCGAVRTEPIQATGHKWDEGKVTTEPTCQPGVKTYTCQNCGETKTESIAATTGHEWVLNEELTVAPTCAKDGVKFYECANCGATQEIVDPATGNHEYNYEYIDASCEEWGIVIITCKNCTYYKQETDSSKPPLEHNYIVNTDDPNYVAPTCVSQGYGTFECTRCNDTYAGPIAALTTNGQHDWIANTDTDDTLTGFALGNDYANVDEAKAAGWTTVTVQNCTTNGVFQRVCDRCGEVETKNAPATGHKPAGYDEWYDDLSDEEKTAHDALSHAQKLNAYFLAQREAQGPIGICMPQDDLTDAQGNKYAFECVNPNCPCEVVVDSYGNTANLVPAVSHTWTNANGTEIPWMPVDGNEADCTHDGEESRTCPVCGFVDVRDVEALDHTWNTIQLDSRTEAIVCATDDALSASATAAQKQALIKAVNEYYKNDAYKANYIINQIQTTLAENSGKSYSRFCFACGALEEAKEHDYVVSKLTDIYDINSYETDEDGNVVVAEGIDATDPTEFTCAYVLVCKNCGTPDHIGSHGTFTTATCRERSECPICHIPGDAQLAHVYLDMDDILNEDTTNGGHADSAQVMNGTVPYTYNNKAVTYGQLRDAYEKLKGDETWMTPVTATCTSSGTEVHICYTCLLDAAAGAEFDWKTTDEAPTEAVNSYSAWIDDVLDGHDWVATYYDVNATDPMTDTAINRATTSCDSGFKVAYFCADCKTLYKNVPVADDPTTTEVVESKDNKPGDHGYTNEAGFVLTENAVDSKIDMTQANQYLAAAQAADLKEVDNHKGDHVVYIDFNFAKTNGYVASNCVEKAVVPVVCVNCGAQLQYTFDELEAMHDVTDGSTDKVNFVFATAQDLVDAGLIKATDDAAKFAIVVSDSTWDGYVAEDGALEAASKLNANNHKNQPFACGDHCNAYVLDEDGTTKHYCSGFSSDGSTVTVGDGTEGTITAAQLEEGAHTTVTVSFQLSARLNTRYLDGYVLNIATVETDDFKADGSIDWTKVDFSTGDKVSKCSATDGNTAIYELPELYPEDGLMKGDISTTETYFVLLKDGVPYPITVNYNVYNEDANKLSSAESMLVSGILGNTTKSETSVSAPQGDNYFVDFNYNTTSDLDNATIVRPEVPVEASDAVSLALAAENAVRTTSADGKVITDTITFKAGATISFTTMEDENLQKFFTEISDSCTETDKVTDVVVDLNGGKLVLPGTLGLNKGSFYGSDDYGYNKLTIKNGTIESTVTSGYAITVDNDANSVVFDNVDIISYNNGISVSYNRTVQTGNVTLQNGSTLTAYGTYGIFINSPDAAAEPTNGRVTVLKLNGATVDMTRNPANLTNESTTDDGWKLSTALFIGAPVNVTVDKSFLKAAGQAVVIRAGTLSMADTELTLYEGYVDPTVEKVGDLGYSNIINITSVGYSTEANKGITFVDGYSMQYWRQLGVWGTGNNVVRAALVIGNSYDPETLGNYYDVATNVTLNRISFVNDTAETGAQNIAIAARYSIAAPTEGSKVGSVNVTWRNNDLKSAVSANSIMSLITLNSDNLGD